MMTHIVITSSNFSFQLQLIHPTLCSISSLECLICHPNLTYEYLIFILITPSPLFYSLNPVLIPASTPSANCDNSTSKTYPKTLPLLSTSSATALTRSSTAHLDCYYSHLMGLLIPTRSLYYSMYLTQ